MKEIKKIFGSMFLKSTFLKYTKIGMFCLYIMALTLCIKDIFTEGGLQLDYVISAGITIIFITIIFVAYIIGGYFNLMHLVKMAFQGMDHKKQAFFIEKIEVLRNSHNGDYYLFDEIFIYKAIIGLVPIQYKNVKKVIVRKEEPSTNIIVYKLKKGFTFHFEILRREDFIDQLVAIKSCNEDIPILFQSKLTW